MQLFVASEGTNGIQKNLEVYSQGCTQGTVTSDLELHSFEYNPDIYISENEYAQLSILIAFKSPCWLLPRQET